MEEVLFDQFDWKIVLEEVTLPDGRTKKTGRAQRPDSVHILAFPSPGRILMLREYRPYYKDYVWMIPSGRMDKENDRDIAAQRELQEETGFKAHKLDYYFSANHSESLIMSNHVYIATGLEPAPLPQDADEMIEVHELSLPEALEKVQTSKKTHTISAYALLRYMHEHR